jgi:hypothetical protein
MGVTPFFLRIRRGERFESSGHLVRKTQFPRRSQHALQRIPVFFEFRRGADKHRRPAFQAGRATSSALSARIRSHYWSHTTAELVVPMSVAGLEDRPAGARGL